MYEPIIEVILSYFQKFDLDVFGGENKQLTDKKKREIFKKLLADAVGVGHHVL